MKNNQGFTLVGLLAIAGMLGVVVTAGIALQKYTNKNKTAETTRNTNQLINNVEKSNNSGSLVASANMQFNNLPNANPDDPSNPAGTNYVPTEEVAGPGNPTGLGTPSGPTGTPTPSHGGACESDTSPCHMWNGNCVLTDADCMCLGNCPVPPPGCTYSSAGPRHPKYDPPPTGSATCPTAAATCTAPYVLQCHAEGSGFSPLSHGGCTPPEVPTCACPGGISDCGMGGACPPGQVHSLPWGACAPAAGPASLPAQNSN